MKPIRFERGIVRFLIFFFILYLGWALLYEWLIHPWGKLDQLVINSSSNIALAFLQLLGYTTFVGPSETIRTIGIDGTHGLWIGDPCNGLTLFALFTSFILAFPGAIRHKFWFIPLGILLIHFINCIRITALCIIVLYKPSWLEFNHTYLFQILIYLFIFGLWWLWIKRYSRSEKATA